MSDAELVELTLDGQDGAFDGLVAKYRRRILSFCFNLVADPEEANDLAQEVFVKAYLSLGSLNDPGKFGSWMFGVAANVCKIWLRRQRRNQVFPMGTSTEVGLLQANANEGSTPAHLILEQNDLARRIVDCMQTLPPDYRILAALRFQSDLKYSEIADFLGLPLSVVKVRLHRARKMIRDRLAGAVFDKEVRTENVQRQNAGAV